MKKGNKEVINFQGKVYLYYSNKGQVIRIATGINWSEQNDALNKKVIDNKLKKLRNIIADYNIDFGGNPSRDYVKGKMKVEEASSKTYLLDFFKEFLEVKYKEVRDNDIKAQSVKDYENLKTAIVGYETHTNNKLFLKDINDNFFSDFKTFLNKVRELNDNTARKRLITFRAFLNYCFSKQYIKDKIEIKKKTIRIGYDPTIVYVNDEEFKNLLDWEDCPKTFIKVRDLFIFGCLTSLRYSDLMTLRKHHIIGNHIVKDSEKTDEQYKIPLTTKSKAILEKYEYQLPYYTNQAYNRMLKDMAEKSGFFNTEIIIETKTGKKKDPTTKKKWQMITTHTARRTFVTRCILKGIPINKIMMMTSHKRLDTIIKYMNKFEDTKKNYAQMLED